MIVKTSRRPNEADVESLKEALDQVLVTVAEPDKTAVPENTAVPDKSAVSDKERAENGDSPTAGAGVEGNGYRRSVALVHAREQDGQHS